MHSGERGSGNLKMFGALLRFFRERAGMTQDGLGAYVKYSKSQVAMVERGERSPKGQFVEIADDVLGAQGALLAAAKELKAERFPSWFEEYAAEESQATAIHMYATHVVPGLLQSEAYARAIFNCQCCPPREDEQVEARLAARLERQRVLRRKPAPVVSFVLEEATLSRPLGGPKTLKEQLHHMLDVSRLCNVELQVMPHARQTHAGLSGPMILLETVEHRQLAYLEGQGHGFFVTEQPDVGHLFGKYGILRAQAMTPDESADHIEQVAREL
ncbi:helix-turn-helix domain-containing protein [Streptomyces alboflavus]|uniref:helix-turn-helix domain-containing protein n=1 Tax=Streptomyces alboflavus TaxID=67267 RepID=UPI0036CDC186